MSILHFSNSVKSFPNYNTWLFFGSRNANFLLKYFIECLKAVVFSGNGPIKLQRHHNNLAVWLLALFIIIIASGTTSNYNTWKSCYIFVSTLEFNFFSFVWWRIWTLMQNNFLRIWHSLLLYNFFMTSWTTAILQNRKGAVHVQFRSFQFCPVFYVTMTVFRN